MQKLAKQFIELLDSKQLLAPDILEELQRQIADSTTRLTPELIAKLLVDNGHLTKFQATKLIAEIKDPDEEAEAAPASSPTANPASSGDDGPASVNDDLGLAGDEATPVATDEGTSETGQPVAAVFIDDDEPSDAPVQAEAVEPAEVVEVVQAVEAVETVEVVEAISETNDSSDGLDVPVSTAKAKKPATAKANPWDSFRILGVGVILALVCIAGFFLVRWALVGNADDALNRANEAYESRSYETASEMYGEFAKNWPTHEQSSFAKVRSALAALRKDSEGAPDPNIGLATALEVLPGIVDESGLAEQRSDLAGALIALATKFNDRADGTKETAERKELMQKMDQLLGLINDPQFVGGAERNQQAPTLLRIEENRQRILREINRDEELAKALKEIDEKLAAKDTLAAYDVRRELINTYPLLEANAQVIDRVQQASKIQQSLVESGSLTPKLEKDVTFQETGRTFLLANNSGSEVRSLQGQPLFVKVKGSVYGLDGGSGAVLWHKFVGREFKNQPLSIGNPKNADALVCEPEKGWVWRIGGKTGETVWRADFGTPIHMPVTDGSDIYVSTLEGHALCLDSEAGQIKWTRKLPQPIPVAPGFAKNRPFLFIPGEHSNLYILDRKDGKCVQVHYLGHRAGAVTVSPELLLGQLFVFENNNDTSSKIRILTATEEGVAQAESQVPLLVEGNVVVSPQVTGRRMQVHSDLGQILVIDVEPTLETNKVSVLATIPKSLLKPQLSWSLFANNRVWLVDKRFTRYDLQVSLGKLNGTWSKNDGDTFTGQPQLFDDVIVHSRVLRGNQGVRVAAVDSESGEAVWQTDLGVPVQHIQDLGGGDFDILNTSGMYFKFDKQPIQGKATTDASQGKNAMRFLNPTSLGNSSTVMFNSSKGNQFATFNQAADPKLQILSANFGRAVPSCPPVAVGDNVAVGLDNGQVALIDPTNGSLAAAPYQPPMQAGRKVTWNRPIYLPDTQTLIVAGSLQKLVRLSVGESLRELGAADLEKPFVGPLAYVANSICAVTPTRSGDTLDYFDAISLEKKKSVPVEGNVIAGPYAIDGGILVQCDEQLKAFSAAGDKLWEADFPRSLLIAAPTMVSGNLVMVTKVGQVWVIAPDSGEVVGMTDAGQSFSSAPVVFLEGLLIGTDEGSVMAIRTPSGGR